MKRFFKSLAFASAALAGFLMTSCNPEEINTTFEPSAAEATITVSVIDAVTGEDVTSSSTIAATTSASNTIEVNGAKVKVIGNKAISEQMVTITATNAGVTSKPVQVPINALLAGGEAQYVALCLVGSPVVADSYSYEAVGKPVGPVVVKTSEFTSSHAGGSHAYSHAVVGHGEGTGNWAYNESEFILEGEISYTSKTGVEVRNIEYTAACVETEKAIVATFAEPYNEGVKDAEESLEIKVSAWAMYSAWGTISETTQAYKVYREVDGKKEAIATFDVVSVSTAAEYVEAAMPGHDGHYSHGHGQSHGHGHGGSNNAGGGIVWAD